MFQLIRSGFCTHLPSGLWRDSPSPYLTHHRISFCKYWLSELCANMTREIGDRGMRWMSITDFLALCWDVPFQFMTSIRWIDRLMLLLIQLLVLFAYFHLLTMRIWCRYLSFLCLGRRSFYIRDTQNSLLKTQINCFCLVIRLQLKKCVTRAPSGGCTQHGKLQPG